MTFFNDDFEASDSTVYVNRQHFRMVFSDNIYGKEGKRFFPGTFDEAQELIEAFSSCGDKEFLFRMYDYPPLFKYEIENWSFSELTCSTLYYYLNTIMVTENINAFSWKLIAELILTPPISRDVFSFVNKNDLLDFSSRTKLLKGIWYTLVSPQFARQYREKDPPLPYVKGLYRLLQLANVEKFVIRVLIKTSFNERNLEAIVKFLEDQDLTEIKK